MTRVRIELNFHEGLQHPLPIEIRRINLALVDRGISTEDFELNEGRYFVTSNLPDGRKLFGQGLVTGEETTILLSVDLDTTGPDPNEVDLFLPGQGIDAPFEIRQFRGNILTGDIDDESRPIPDLFSFSVEGRTSTPIIQVLKGGVEPLNILIPAYSSEQCEVLISPTREGPVKFEIRLKDRAADLLLQYLGKGYLREAATLSNLAILSWDEDGGLLLITLYTLLRVGELPQLARMIDNSGQWFYSELFSPDSSAIRGEILARLGRHNQAFEAFLELESRGVPVFTDGVFYATQRLKIYRRALKMSSLKRDISSYAILRRLQRITTYQTPGYPIVAYTGLDLMEPNAVPYFPETRPQDHARVGAREPGWSIAAELLKSLPTGPFIGVNFGNTYSSVVIKKEHLVIVGDANGNSQIPSIVSFEQHGGTIVGYRAQRLAVVNPVNTIHSIKRLLGRRYDEVSEHLARLSYTVVRLENDRIGIRVGDRDWSPEEIAAVILRRLRDSAQESLGQTITRAVITVPASFDSAQRQAIRNAASIAGLTDVNLINEPSAAALAYVWFRYLYTRQKVAVLNFGGGSFDVSVIEVGPDFVKVISTDGDPFLGGDDIDDLVIDWVRNEFLTLEGIDLLHDKQAVQRMREAAQAAKIKLSTQTEAHINLPFIAADEHGPKHFSLVLTREKFEELIAPLLDRLLPPLQRVLESVAIDVDDIYEVLLVGGSTRIPKVQEVVSNRFASVPLQHFRLDIAFGAARQAEMIDSEQDLSVSEVLPLSIGLETLGGIFTKIFDRNTPLPASTSQIFSTASDNQTSVEVHLFQGERPMTADNRSLGKFTLSGIPPRPRGAPQIEVVFDIDASGVITVSAKDLETGRRQETTFTGSSGLSTAEVNRLRDEAELFSEADLQRLKVAESRNRIEPLIQQVKQASGRPRMDQRATRFAESAIAAADEALRMGDVVAIERAAEQLNAALYRLRLQVDRAEGVSAGSDLNFDADVES